MKLPPQPTPPLGVKYALTVPQSVLFADLSLQGNRREYFMKAMAIDYEPQYIVIDRGAMSWNYDRDDAFYTALTRGGSLSWAINTFISTMGSTHRLLDRVSRIVSASDIRRQQSRVNISEDLNELWHAYKLHMVSLFTFWNVEQLLSATLIEQLMASGHQDEVRRGLSRFFQPRDPNYFVLERRQLQRLADRFYLSAASHANLVPDSQLVNAIQRHIRIFGFLLSPFNVGGAPTVDDVLRRLKNVRRSESVEQAAPLLEHVDVFEDLTPDLQVLGQLAVQLSFWKTERLDVLSLADSRAHDLYLEAAAVLSIPLETLFAMTCTEILDSLAGGPVVVPADELRARQKGFCLALYDHSVLFYEPSQPMERVQSDLIAAPGTVLHGIGASSGTVTGPVRVLRTESDYSALIPGEILVAAMTRPEMGAALDNAAGFITDEGGLLCHAAIISREMNKPCVISVEVATQLLVTGTVVSIDGDSGQVAIVS